MENWETKGIQAFQRRGVRMLIPMQNYNTSGIDYSIEKKNNNKQTKQNVSFFVGLDSLPHSNWRNYLDPHCNNNQSSASERSVNSFW